MKIVYIAHPIGGDVENNLRKIAIIARQMNLTEPDCVPFAPYFLDCVALRDAKPEERRRGLRNGAEVFKRGNFDEVRLYGDRISPRMLVEVILARQLGIKIVAVTEETKAALKKI